MNIPRVTVDLRQSPAQRWAWLESHRNSAATLIGSYTRDLGDTTMFDETTVLAYASTFATPDELDDLDAVANILDRPLFEVVIANLYYDAIKVVLGCTAFAVDSPRGPLHGRNLDWWTLDGRLSTDTMVIEYVDGDVRFEVVAWPGYVGALSGVAPGRFAVTLNAVLSTEPWSAAPPISLVLRRLLHSAESYDDVVLKLEGMPIATDCLLLVTGTSRGEMVVIERTPTQSATRRPKTGYVIATNDYLELASLQQVDGDSPLEVTSCTRRDRAEELIVTRRPETLNQCFSVLRDAGVQMDMTVQQMAFHAASGTSDVRVP